MSRRPLLSAALAALLAAACKPTSPPAPPVETPAPAPAPAPPPPAPPVSDFTFAPAGELHPGSGTGYTDPTIYAPGMRYPIEAPKAYANSQVYGRGGMQGGGGVQCDPENYSYPWRDNFCETRGYSTPLCPTGKGHQGQDIRPNTCVKGTYAAVAAEAGTITQIGSYTVYLTADSGRIFRYLHLQMNKLDVAVGDVVARGDKIGLVSNNFGSTATTIHLHFEIKQPVTDGGTTITTFTPPYTSLVDAYQRLEAGAP